MLKKVDFCSQHLAEKLLPEKGMALISITSPGKPLAQLQAGWDELLRLEFHDVDVEGSGYLAFSAMHSRLILDFVAQLPASIHHVVVHCHAGVSRSAAVARFIAGKYGLQFPEKYPLYNKRVYAELTQEDNRQRYGHLSRSAFEDSSAVPVPRCAI